MNLQKRVNAVARKLQARGVKPLKVDRGSELSDPAIWITETIYVQVGLDYVVIFDIKNNGLSSYFSTLHINDIMNSLKQAINDGN